MILGQISYLDCLVFVILLAPQLLIQVGLIDTLRCAIQALPFLFITLPISLFNDHLLLPRSHRPAHALSRPLFTDIVLRTVNYAFANIPSSIGRVFFSSAVSGPFLRFRMLRHGLIRFPVPLNFETINPTVKAHARTKATLGHDVHGIWLCADRAAVPDSIVLYLHGGGFAMGSPSFYAEFLAAWVTLLADALPAKNGKRANPALFAPAYTLVPDAAFPTQLEQCMAAYDWALRQLASAHGKVREPGTYANQVHVAGDSAGATLVLSMLLRLAKEGRGAPESATLISPWCRLVSEENRNTPADYLDAESLHKYAKQYVKGGSTDDDVASPGNCMDMKLWKTARPKRGYHFVYGGEEVFAPGARELVGRIRRAEGKDGDAKGVVRVTEEQGAVHAWPVVALFLGETREERLKGLRVIVRDMVEHMNSNVIR